MYNHPNKPRFCPYDNGPNCLKRSKDADLISLRMTFKSELNCEQYHKCNTKIYTCKFRDTFLQSDELLNFYSSPNLSRIINSRRTRGSICSMHGKDKRKAYKLKRREP
jgi:hypothetical protein